MRKANIYALYKGDKFIDLGTREYLAKLLNCTTTTISFYCKPAYLKRIKNKGNSLIVIRIED